MSSPVTNVPANANEKAKLALAAALFLGGLIGFYWLGEARPLLVRLAAFLAGVAAAVAVLWFTELGQRLVAFFKEAISEAKRVTWPTRQETIQTTVAVFAFALLMSIFLWLTDKTVEWVLYDLILGWRR